MTTTSTRSLPIQDSPAVVRVKALAQTFPSLRGNPNVTAWNPEALLKDARTAGHGEKLAIQFVLHVWNGLHKWPCGVFNPIEAYYTWDDEHWAAFKAWVDRPFTV